QGPRHRPPGGVAGAVVAGSGFVIRDTESVDRRSISCAKRKEAVVSEWRFIVCGMLAVIATSATAADKVMPASQRLVHAAQPWLPNYAPDDPNLAYVSAASKLVCRRSEDLPIPRSDLPGADELPALTSCNS